jgi:hypothetical protein
MRLVRSALAILVLAGLGLALVSAPAMAAPAPEAPELVKVRAAHHPGFDRITFEFRGGLPSSHTVRYVSNLTEDPTGDPIDLAGGATLEVVFHGVNAHDIQTGKGTVTPAGGFSPGLPSLKEVAPAGDFEAVVSYGLGVDHRVPFKVLELSGPPRIAIDISTGGASAGSGSTGTTGPGSLPFTGAGSTGMLITGLSLAATGVLVLALAHRTRTPSRGR